MIRLTDAQRELAATAAGTALRYGSRVARLNPRISDTIHDACVSGLMEAAVRFRVGNDDIRSFPAFASWYVRLRILDTIRKSHRGLGRKETYQLLCEHDLCDRRAGPGPGDYLCEELFAGLPPGERGTAYAYFVDGLSAREIGDRESAPRGRIFGRIRASLARLREHPAVRALEAS